jgi:hypothetical protein
MSLLGKEREREGVSFTLKSSQLKKQQNMVLLNMSKLTRTKKYPTFSF